MSSPSVASPSRRSSDLNINIHLPTLPSASNGFTLLLPLPSHSSTPQLAADVLIHSLELRRVGWIGDGGTGVGFVGVDENELVTGGMELYGKDDFPYLVIQQRSPVLKSQKSSHLSLLISLLSTHSQIKGLLVLVGADDSAASEEGFLEFPFRGLVGPGSRGSEGMEGVKALSIRDSESAGNGLIANLRKLQPYRYTSPEAGNAEEEFPPFIPGGGLARRLFDRLQMACEAKSGKDQSEPEINTRWGGLILWCAEGDNRGAAMAMAEMALRLIGHDGDVELREPKSWEGLFGGRIGQGIGRATEIYG